MSTLRFGPPPPSTLTVDPSAEEIAFYEEHGYLVVDRITTDDELAWLEQIFDAVFAEESTLTFEPGREVDQVGPPLIQQSMFPEMRYPELLESTFHRNAKRYASALTGLPEATLLSWGHMIVKPPKVSRAAPWHQDEAYWEPELSYNAIASWLPLHDVTVERGCMQFIPRSHKGPLLMHHHTGDVKGNLIEADGVETAKAVACPLKAGGATFHHPRTLHFTEPNTTDLPRKAFPTEFQLAPVPAEDPVVHPWTAEFRAATGGTRPSMYIADGQMVTIGASR